MTVWWWFSPTEEKCSQVINNLFHSVTPLPFVSRLQPKRVFQTVKNLNLMRQQRSSLAPSPLNIPGSNQTSCLTSGRSSRVGTPRSNSIYGSEMGSEMGSGIILDNRTSSILEGPDDGYELTDVALLLPFLPLLFMSHLSLFYPVTEVMPFTLMHSVYGYTYPSSNCVFLSRSEDSNKRPPGTPGTPGSRDLEAALRRLSLRRDNYLSEKRFFEEERERKLAYLAKEEEKGGRGSSGGPGTPTESLFSLCSHPSLGSIWSGYSFTARSYLPEKLQIVKPLEGDDFSQRHTSSNTENAVNDNESAQKHQQNSNCVYPQATESYTQTSQTQSHTQHQDQYLMFHNDSPSRIYLSATQRPKTLQRSSSLMELSSQQSTQLHLTAPLALVRGLLEALEQQGGSLNLQHSFYFRHTQPRCWFEV